MRLPDFYAALQQRCLPTVDAVAAAPSVPKQLEAERRELTEAILAVDQAVRLDRPEPFPELDLASALWATERLYELWFGSPGLDAAAPEFLGAAECPGAADVPRTHYSVDLVLRHLPHVIASAATTTERAAAVRRLAAAWPLAAVLVPGTTSTDPAPVLADPALRRAYGERILRRREGDRPQDAATLRCLEQLLDEHRAFATDVLAHHEELIRRPDL